MPFRTYLEPCDDRLVIEPLIAKGRTKGGLVIPEAAKEAPGMGTVLAVGPGKLLQDGTRAPMGFREGEIVMFGRFTASPVAIGSREFLILKAMDVFGVVREEEVTQEELDRIAEEYQRKVIAAEDEA